LEQHLGEWKKEKGRFQGDRGDKGVIETGKERERREKKKASRAGGGRKRKRGKPVGF